METHRLQIGFKVPSETLQCFVFVFNPLSLLSPSENS